MKTQKGITLIALIVTVSVLVILTAVTITTVTNDEIKDKTKNTVSAYELLQEKEKLQNEVMRWDLINNDGVPTLQNYMAGIYGEENVQLNVDNSLTVTVPSGNRYIVTKDGNVTLIDETTPEPEVSNISVSLDKTTITKEIKNGKAVTETITATLNNATGKLTWGSSDPDVAQIATSEGNERIIKFKKEGTATITVAYAENKNIASVCTIEVVEPVNITLDKTTIEKEIFSGSTATETITATLDVEGKTVTWSSSNTSVASVVGNGNTAKITLQPEGTATITASCGRYSATCTVTVTEIKVAQIGDYVRYDVSYTDMYQGTTYTKTNGWRYLGTDDSGNKLLISTAIPVVLYYHYSTAGENAKWWDTNTTLKEQVRATNGMINNFAKIPYTQTASGTSVSKANTAIGRFAGTEVTVDGTTYTAIGDYFKSSTYSSKIENVRTLTLAELNRATNSATGSSREETSTSAEYRDLTDEALGLFQLKDNLSNYKASYKYWLATPKPDGNLGQVYYIQPGYVGVATHQRDSIGVRPVVVLSFDVELLDTNGDGVFEIKY